MLRFQLALLIGAAAVFVTGTGCGRKEAAPVDPKVLEESFKAAAPEIRQNVAATSQAIQAAAFEKEASAKATQYVQALQPLQNVVAKGNLSKEQLQLMLIQFQQVSKAVQNDPHLANDKALYQARNAAAQALHRAGVMP
jgi:hypothetical protein